MKRKLLALIIVMLLAMGTIFTAGAVSFAADAVYTNNTLNVVVSSDDGSCNLRTGPGMAYGLIQPIYNGNALRITAVSANSSDGLVWGQTTYNGYTGWISMMLTYVTDVENASPAVYDVTVTEPDYIYLRRGPGAEYDSIYRPYRGQSLRIDRTIVNSFDGRPWGRTYVNGMQGWVSLNWTSRTNSWTYNQTQNVTFTDNIYTAVVSSDDGFLNFRTGPGMSYPVIQPVYNGNSLYVTAVQENSNDGLVWGQTYINGTYGWVCMSPTTITNMERASTAQYNVTVQNSSNIVLRKGPGTEYDALVGYIQNGTSLFITQTVINSFDGRPWGKTRVNGIDGWVSLNWTYRS